MSVSNKNIADLNGVQFFTSLVYLICDNNSLTNLPSLPNSLQHLSCSNNPSLPNSLTYLSCRNNSLTNLPVLPNSIQNIFCENNSLTNLPTLPTSLLSLWCGNNSLLSLPALPNSLQQLLCYSNSLTTLPSLPNSLQVLNCGFNNIICFPRLPDSLIQVFIDTNPYNCLPNFVLPAMNNYTNTPLCAPGNASGCAVVGLEEINSNNYQLNIYPNPASMQFIIETTAPDEEFIQLFDLSGKLLFEQNINNKANIDATNLNAGIYNITIKSVGKVTNKKLVIIR
jgi:Secretion system C-terminal sorting domain